MKHRLEYAVEIGIEFLARKQQPDGSFMCMTTMTYDDYTDGKIVPAIVPSSIVLSSLIYIPTTPVLTSIKQKVAAFLISERSEYWSFNYWLRSSLQYLQTPYPDDLDDTFCALAALYEYENSIYDGSVMARIVTMLTITEIGEGGPYNMWLVPDSINSKWKDIDLVVNCNIGFFLSLLGISLPNINRFVEESVDKNTYEFPYNTIYPSIYFISRFYKGTHVQSLVTLLMSKVSDECTWENPLRTALAVSALINLSDNAVNQHIRPTLENAITYILDTQLPDGSWPAYSFFYQMNTKEKTLYAGSTSITTALCLEAINKFSMLKEEIPIAQKKEEEPTMSDIVYKRATKTFLELGIDLQKQSLSMLCKMKKRDVNKHILLLSENLDTDFIVTLCLANLYGWMAYTIYDNFLDMSGDVAMLSVANLCLRESYTIFSTILPEHTGFPTFVKHVFDMIDEANSVELAHYRAPYTSLPTYNDYSLIANKSLGHVLGPVALLYAQGYKENSREVKNLITFFKHYLIARQLTDDAHDWKEDLAKGHISPVVAKLLQSSPQENPKDNQSKEMEQLFWNNIIPEICGDILKEIARARKSLKKLSMLQGGEHPCGLCSLCELLLPLEQSARKTLSEYKNTKKFLRTYHQ